MIDLENLTKKFGDLTRETFGIAVITGKEITAELLKGVTRAHIHANVLGRHTRITRALQI